MLKQVYFITGTSTAPVLSFDIDTDAIIDRFNKLDQISMYTCPNYETIEKICEQYQNRKILAGDYIIDTKVVYYCDEDDIELAKKNYPQLFQSVFQHTVNKLNG